MITATRRRFITWIALAAIVMAASAGYPAVSHALFTDAPTAAGNTFTSGTWRTYWLHNNPTPPTGNTNRQANLPMNTSAPTATVLRNYDQDADSSAGRMIDKGGTLTTTDLVKYQNWRTPALTSSVSISGAVTVTFWSAIKDFGTGKAGSVTIYLRNFNPANSTYTTIGSTTVTAANWQNGSNTWVSRTATINVADHTLVAGRQLEVKIIVGDSSGDALWFAYDTTTYPTRVALP